MTLNFKQRAERLGHSAELLAKGLTVKTTITVNDIDQLKDLFSDVRQVDANPNVAKQLFGDIPLTKEADDRSIAGTLRRVNEFLYGDAELSSGDRERAAGAFPMAVVATSAEESTPTEPVKIYDPVNQQILNYGTLTLNDGIYINVYNTVIQKFDVDKLVRNGSSGNSNIGDINIFGATGANGDDQPKAGAGPDGSAGKGGTCTVSGSEPGNNGGAGGAGTTGAAGNAGGQGLPGQPSRQAVFTISAITGDSGNVLFYTRSGTGGSGGKGGDGGDGGNGGKGGNGKTCECTGTKGGNGGRGGAGGDGGRGGNSGDAVNAAGNIVINVAQEYAAMISHNNGNANPGVCGSGGAGGTGGAGGGGSSGGKGKSGGSAGTAGAGGKPGDNGNQSQVTGQGATFQINTF